MERVIEIPDAFLCAPFFEGSRGKIVYGLEQTFEEVLQSTYFLIDIEKQYEPWNEFDKSIPIVLNIWKSQQEDIARLFRNRKRKEAKAPMVQFIAHILSAVHWLNEKPVPGLKDMLRESEELNIKPVNFMERYSYMIEQPDHYHSYIQLTQMYVEIEKLYAKKMIIKKKSLSR
ncbi:YpoC family protein [Bacillus sp. C1]